MPRSKIPGVATRRKIDMIEQLEELVSADGYTSADYDEDLMELRNKLHECGPWTPGTLNKKHCWEVQICPRCNRNHQDRVAKDHRIRTIALLKAGCIPVRLRGSVPANDDLIANLKQLGDTIEEVVDCWKRPGLKSIWTDVVAGSRWGIHVAKNQHSGTDWYCHVHAVIWLNPSKPAGVKLAMRLLRHSWLNTVGPHTPYTFVDVRACFKSSTSAKRKLELAEEAGDYLLKLWEFSDLDSILKARTAIKFSKTTKNIRLTKTLGLCHLRSKLPDRLAYMHLTKKRLDVYFADGIIPNYQYTRRPCVFLCAPEPPTQYKNSVAAVNDWQQILEDRGKSRRYRGRELAIEARAKSKTTVTTVTGRMENARRAPIASTRRTNANTNIGRVRTLREGAAVRIPAPPRRTRAAHIAPALQNLDRDRNPQATGAGRRSPDLPSRRPTAGRRGVLRGLAEGDHPCGG